MKHQVDRQHGPILLFNRKSVQQNTINALVTGKEFDRHSLVCF